MPEMQTVIFDLDGTLLDSLQGLADSVNYVCETEGFPQRSLEEIRNFVGNGITLLLRRALPANLGEADFSRCSQQFRQHYSAHMCESTKPYPEIPALLDALHARGVRTGVVSNKVDSATRQLVQTLLGSRVDIAIGERVGVPRKPAPDSVWAAMQVLGARRETTLYVGDSDVDMQTAKAAGLVSVGVTWGFRSEALLRQSGAQHIIHAPMELLTLL